MANPIKLQISGDATLQKNVTETEQIYNNINNAYQQWKKLANTNISDDNKKFIADMKAMTAESKNLNKEEKERAKQLAVINKLQKDYDNSVKQFNSTQNKSVSELSKLNSEIIALQKNQKLLKAQNLQTSDSFAKNQIRIKQLQGEYRKLESAEVKHAQSQKTIQILSKKTDLTLKEQKQLYSALAVQLDKLVTSEGKASRATIGLQKQMKQLNTSILKAESSSGRFQRNVGNYPKGLSGMQMAFAGVLGAVTAVIGVLSTGIRWATEWLNLAQDQILAETKFETIVKQRTNATEEEIQAIYELTSAQQQLGVVGDEVQLAGAQQLATFIDNTDQLELLIPAMNNLLVQQKGLDATQQDAVQIANLYGKVLDGNASALTEVGVTLTDAQKEMIKYGDRTERAAVLSEVITQNVGNMNEAIAQTPFGAAQQLKNIWGDIKEELGKALLPLYQKLIEFGKRFVNGLAPFVQKLQEFKVPKWIKDLYNVLKTKIQLPFDLKKFEQLKTLYEKLKPEIQKVVQAFKPFIDVLKQIFSFSDVLGKKTDDNFDKLNNNIGLIKGALNVLAPVIEFVGNLLRLVVGVVTNLVDKLKDFAQTKVFSKFSGDISTTFPFLNALIEGVQIAFGWLKDLGSQFDLLVDKILKQTDKAGSQLSKIRDDLRTQQDQTIGRNINAVSDIATPTGATGGGQVDIFAEYQLQQAQELAQKELELRQQYKDDLETIEVELLKLQQSQQLDLLTFIDNNNLYDKKTEQQLNYISISENLRAKELAIEQALYQEELDAFLYMQDIKNLENENYILQMQSNGAEEIEIEFQTLQQKKEMLEDYLAFLQANANDQNEIERLSVQNQLLDIENQFNDLTDRLNQQNADADIKKLLGLTDDQINDLKSSLFDLGTEVANFWKQKYSDEIEYYQKSRELLDEGIQAENDRIQSLQESLNAENDLRNSNLDNNALLTESLIRQSQLRIEAKRQEQNDLIKAEQEAADKLKAIQKREIYAQFAIDTASAISSLVKFAYANPLNSFTSGLAAVAQITSGLISIGANFAKARSSIKQLKEGEIDIKEGNGQEDDVPALLMKGESVITQDGTKRAPNFLKGLNKKATTDQLMRYLQADFGIDTLKEYNLIVYGDSFETRRQNEILQNQVTKLVENNVYLQELIKETRNKPVIMPIPNGYKERVGNTERTYKYE